MAKPSPKSKRKPSRPGSRLPLRLLLWLAVAGIAVAAVCVAARTVWGAVLRQPQFRVNARALNLSGCGGWVRGQPMVRALHKELSSLPEGASVFTADLAHRVQHELRGSPWVLDVTAVQRRLPDRIVVTVAFRKPAGVVLFNGMRLLVDEDGHWLPDALFTRPQEWAGEYTPDVVDRTLQSPPPIGTPWGAPKLAVGARLTAFFRRNGLFERPHVTAIDVTGVGRNTIEPEIVLTAASGAQIKWGRSSVYRQVQSLSPPAFEPLDSEKLEALMSRLKDYPGLNGIGSGYVDLRVHGQLVISRGN